MTLPTVLLAGNPNVGKTTLFNQLAGTRARTGNFPGVTVERRAARLKLPDGQEIELADLPGTYSLSARSPEEQIAAHEVLAASPAVVVVVVDATALERSLYLAVQVLESDVPTVIALNMMDEARAAGASIDSEALGASLGAPVVEVVAAQGSGVDELQGAIARALGDEATPLKIDYQDAEPAIEELAPRGRAEATWALLSLGDDELEVEDALRRAAGAARKTAEDKGVDLDQTIVRARYDFLEEACQGAHRPGGDPRAASERLDDILMHPVAGMVVFALTMLVIFEALFAWSDPLIGLIEDGVGWLQQLVVASMAEGPLRDLLVDGVIAGVGNVVVFVPQIALLFLLITFLEDSGYLARVAFVIDRLMKGVGLHGKAFVPLLSGFACAIPAVMATRTIANRKDRLVTMLALPLMSCSARLPVYVLLTATIFAGQEPVLGVISVGAAVLFVMYALSVIATLGAAAVLRRTVLKGPRPTLVLELPPYRWPTVTNLLSTTWARVRSFLVDAGTIILALTIVLWALVSFPKDSDLTARYDALREEAAATLDGEALEERVATLDAEEASGQLSHSAGGRMGKAIEPVLRPLGMDWRVGIGVIGAFAAREVFVSTLGIVFGVGSEVDEESDSLREQLRSATHADGAPLMTPLSGIALMVFFVFAAQCMSTIAVIRRESGSWKWPLVMFGYMTGLAYGAALLVYQVGSALGLGTG
ncbi:MAG: ferrous iron transport protein B [Myxococcota bacterium]